MATRTASQSGPWGTSATWGGAAAPGAGDRAVIGAFAITVDATQTIGSSPDVNLAGTGTVGTGGISSTTLGGSGCAFTTQLNIGDIITIGSTERIVTAIANDNSLTMSTAATLADGQSFTYNNVAIYLSSTSSRLTINAPLTIKGCMSSNYASTTAADVVTIAAGQGIEFDASSSPSTTATKYRWVTQGANNQSMTIKASGTSGSRCYIRSNAGGGNAWLDRSGTSNGTNLDLAYTDVTRIGDSTNPLLTLSMGGMASSKVVLNNCVFDGCGMLTASAAINASATYRVTGCRWVNTASSTYCLTVASNTNSATCILEKSSVTGKYNYFDKSVNFSGGPNAWTVSGSIFGDRFGAGGTARWSGTWTDCWFRQTADTWSVYGNLTNSVLYWDNPVATNPHFIQLAALAGTADITISGNALYFNGTDATGNCMLCNVEPASTTNVYIKNNIALPNAANTNSGAFFESGGNVNGRYQFNVTHNTVWVDGQDMLEIGHLQTAVEGTNRWALVGSNLVIGGSGSSRYNATDFSAGTLTDIIPPANITKNARYQILATKASNSSFTNQANGWAAKFSTTPGTTDINLDATSGPNFVGASTGFPATSFLSQWDASLGGAGTDANAWTQVAAGTSGYTPAAFLAYLAIQLAPRNTLLKDAGHDGVTIGAVEGVWTSGLFQSGGGFSCLNFIEC